MAPLARRAGSADRRLWRGLDEWPWDRGRAAFGSSTGPEFRGGASGAWRRHASDKCLAGGRGRPEVRFGPMPRRGARATGGALRTNGRLPGAGDRRRTSDRCPIARCGQQEARFGQMAEARSGGSAIRILRDGGGDANGSVSPGFSCGGVAGEVGARWDGDVVRSGRGGAEHGWRSGKALEHTKNTRVEQGKCVSECSVSVRNGGLRRPAPQARFRPLRWRGGAGRATLPCVEASRSPR